jgi:hypothetical protein
MADPFDDEVEVDVEVVAFHVCDERNNEGWIMQSLRFHISFLSSNR